jgi:1-phosphofructokinase family hexose kinase
MLDGPVSASRPQLSLLTVTPNPSLDLLYSAESLRWDDANRVDEPRRRPGGQGINVARVAKVLGARVTAVALLGGPTGEEIQRRLADEGTPIRAVTAEPDTRLFIAVHTTRANRSLLINGRGHSRTTDDAERLLELSADAMRAQQPHWVAGCGSLPPGFPIDFYSRLGRMARENGARFVADCDGGALGCALGECDLLVPNHHEAARLLGWKSADRRALAEQGARALLGRGPAAVAVTLGPRGAVLATKSQSWHARAPRQSGVAVGAGDAFLAALLVATGSDEPSARALACATAAGAAVLRSLGNTLMDPADYQSLLAETAARPVGVRRA